MELRRVWIRFWCGRCQKSYWIRGFRIKGGYSQLVIVEDMKEHFCVAAGALSHKELTYLTGVRHGA